MKALVVAHPDDEILWFNPAEFDLIVIVFGDFGDGRSGTGRRAAIENHPLKERILHLNLTESNFWRDPRQAQKHEENFEKLCWFLKTLAADEVTTHNAMGEYQHADHILVHNACMATLNCPVNGKDPDLYRRVKKVYQDAGCWTWY
jgi:LmbE family N-acetylglucosaminyl deacetylase